MFPASLGISPAGEARNATKPFSRQGVLRCFGPEVREYRNYPELAGIGVRAEVDPGRTDPAIVAHRPVALKVHNLRRSPSASGSPELAVQGVVWGGCRHAERVAGKRR